MPEFDDLIEDVNDVCLEVVGDDEGTLTDGVVPAAAKTGFFHEEFNQVVEEQYGLTTSDPTFECAESAIAGLDKARIKLGAWKYRPADRSFDYVVKDLRGPTKGMVLLVLTAP